MNRSWALALCFTGCVSTVSLRPELEVQPSPAPHEARLPMRAELVIPYDVRIQEDEVLKTSSGLVQQKHRVTTGALVADALTQLSRDTFSSVKVVPEASGSADVDVVIEPVSVQVDPREDAEGGSLFMSLAMRVEVRGEEPRNWNAFEQVPFGGAAGVFGNWAGPSVSQNTVRELVTRLTGRFGEQLRDSMGLLYPAQPKETLDPGDVMTVVEQHLPAVRRCVATQRRSQPDAHGRLLMRWQVLASGQCTQVEVLSDELAGTALASCVAQEIPKWRFPQHRREADPVTMPFDF